MLSTAVGCSWHDAGNGPAVPKPSGPAAAMCRSLHDGLPGTVDGLTRSASEPASEFTAAWGDPEVRLRCGVPRPAVLTPGNEDYNPTAEAVDVNGVSWLLEKQGDGYRFTTTGRRAFVEVTVPDDYAPEVNALTDLAKSVRKTVPSEL
ncbi:DUF3515 domain-containing protein [Streptomyces sp. MTZ3.1]|uniref:DUF3515 domain-containing protein n=1 Tax=Streptomyces meridianus TaxID=2938945 RepID=A0ABT0X8A5_9ACTN|nr:DUF3515 domain-containing protein [Streptomyces meridianus]